MAKNNNPGKILKSTKATSTLKSASGLWTLDEAMQAHRANAWPQPNLFQPVANSLRLDGSRQEFLSRAISRSGNQRTWTWSGWFKPSTTAGSQYLVVSTNTNGNPFTFVYFSDGNFIWWDGGQVLITTAKYRDISAWYHVVLAVDTTQSTAANRGKLYINGVQVTSFSVANYPAQGAKTYTNSNAATENIVYISAPPGYVQGYLGEVNFVDGYQLDPSLLGKFDTNNTWVPVAYTGSYGTNGFYLPFTNTTSSQALGYDASVNGTATYDADQDPYRGSVALHLTGNGPAGGNNNVFADSSPNNLAITRVGTATQGSFSPFPLNTNTPYNPSVHGASAYLNGASTLSVGSFPAIGTQDFTVECWVYAISTAATGGSNPRVFDLQGIQLVIEDTGRICRLDWNDSNVLYATGSGVFQINQWNHIAVVRISNTVSFYLNGVAQTGGTRSENLVGGTGYIGTYRGGTTGFWNGYISGLRATIGSGIYTAAFTPTMRPFGTLTNNLISFSEDFSNTNFWINPAASVAATITSNSAIAPDGTPSAFTVNYSVAGSTHPCYQNITVATANTSSCTASMYVKYSSGTTFALQNTFFNGAGPIQDGYGNITFTNGVASVAASSANMTVSSTDVGNGWYRIKVTATNNSGGASTYSRISIGQSGIVGSIYVWGAQLETGSLMTNYTPTPANFSTAPSLLLNFANAAVVDSVGANNALTGDNATISSASKYGSGALSFTSNGYLSFAPGAQYAFGTGNFTIEAWVRTTETTGDTFYRRIYMTDGPTGNASGNIQLTIAPSTGYANLWDGGGLDMLSTTNISTGAWFHIAATRVGTTLRLFVNGRQEAISSYNTSIAPNSGNPRPWVGAYNTTQGRWNGQIDDLRVTNGVARYQADFTPPARALPETGGKSFVTNNVNAGVVQRFTTTGTTAWTAPSDVTSVEVLVVAGGGGGGGDQAGGGGGAGGVIYNNQYAVTPGQTYTVVVGAGGAGNGTRGTSPSSYFFGATGGNSQFGNLIASGGGGGASMIVSSPTSDSYGAGRPGGSGGGASNWLSTTTGAGGAGVAGQGFNGGSSTVASGNGHIGGGGGGAGAAGGNATNPNPGAGGAGLPFGILGTPYYFAGGGGGGSYFVTAGVGGIGGGGGGASNTSTSSAGGGSALNSGATGVTGGAGGAGGANTGGGGGGAGGTGGAGGSGIVLIRYTTTAVGNTSDSTTDHLVDSPTQYGHDYGNGGEVVGNYCTWSPLPVVNYGDGVSYKSTLSNGNLTASFGSQFSWAYGSIGVPANAKTYIEYTINSYTSTGNGWIGFSDVASLGAYFGVTVNGSVYIGDGSYNVNNSPGFATGDILGFAIDRIGNTLTLYKNGSQVYNVALAYGITSSTVLLPAVWTRASGDQVSLNAGQRPWAYAPPAGFNALTTKNFARLTAGTPAANPNQYFDVSTWTQGATDVAITNAGGFQPDLVWIKSRSNSQNHYLMDSVRGTTGLLRSNGTGVESTGSTWITFNSNGFTPSSANTVTNTYTYVGWQWKAGGAAVSNTAGTIASQVSANTASGFSVVTYTGTGVNATVGHGLGVAPSMYICKRRNVIGNWRVYHTSLSYTTYINFDTGGAAADSSVWNSAPTTSVFGIGTNDMNTDTGTYVAYCWAEVPGFSKFGTYTGNGSATDGPFIYTGFKPAFYMAKCTSATSNAWIMYDNKRSTYNLNGQKLGANVADEENNVGNLGDSTTGVDFLSNGIKIRSAGSNNNTSAATYIYMAFAGSPFGNVNGTAR